VRRVNHTKTLGLFRRTYYPIVDDTVATDALTRLDRVFHGESPDLRTGALAILAALPSDRDTGYSQMAFPGPAPRHPGTPKRQLTELYDRLCNSGWCDKPLRETLHAIAGTCHARVV
jgi:hypothetical protein